MKFLVLLTAALLPAILLWVYIWKKDPQKEPTAWLVKAVLWGVFICIPVIFLENIVQTMLFGIDGQPTNIFGTTLQAFFVAALPEESLKLLALWIVLRHNPFFDEHYDGIIYAVCMGLGFAALENVGYIFSAEEDWMTVSFCRALLAVPGHYAFAILMGYYYSLYHFVDHSPKVAASILLSPVLAHGMYDALALSGSVSSVLGGICFLVLIYFCVKMHKVAKGKMMAMIEKDNTNNNIA